jgi:AGZA family xanthine/uracil permease-like MFS transporter
MSRYRWAHRGDLNAFFGLMLDNIAVMIFLLGAISAHSLREDRFSFGFVLHWMIPGTILGVVIGDLIFTYLAFRLARRTGRTDVTAMPLGLDTPSTIGVAFLLLLPALKEGQERLHLNHELASFFAWHVGAVTLVLAGVFKTLCAPFGNAVRRLVPRAGMLGSLAAIALALIAFIPLLTDIAPLPVVGMAALTIILVSLQARRALPFQIPGALAAVLLGLLVHYICLQIGQAPAESATRADWVDGLNFPAEARTLGWWKEVFASALSHLPVMLPFALATIVGGIDCTESAAAAGDEYDTRSILFTEALASLAAGLFGGVIQTTPYIGQPAYKAMGGRAAYTLATAVFVGIAGSFGWFDQLFQWLPRAAMFPILVFVGLEITAQSFHATPVRHYPAVAIAILPALAYLATIPLDLALAGRTPDASAAVVIQALRCLANGFIVTSLLWAGALAAMIDGRDRRAAIYLLVAAGCALIGIIHSPLATAPIALPPTVMAQLPAEAAFQSPYHWAAAYGLMAGLLFLLAPWMKMNAASD